MTTRAESYATASRDFLRKGREALEQGDLTQASEKLWGATAQMVKAVAEERGWAHGGHRELFQVVSRLAQDSADPTLRGLFHVANSLHSNFYENWMEGDMVAEGLDRVQELISKLEAA